VLKFIVIGDVLYGFYGNLMHTDVEDSLRQAGITGDIQSAGDIRLYELNGSHNRILGGSSVTLLSDGKMKSREESDAYQQSNIMPALGEFFVYSDL